MKPIDLATQRLTGFSWIGYEPWTPEREARELARPRSSRDGADLVPQAPEVFRATHPPTGRELPTRFFAATPGALNNAVPFPFGDRRIPEADRAALLNEVAARCTASADQILAMASRESGLTRRRLSREFNRMVGTLRLFANLVEEGSWVRAAIDTRSQQAIGPGHDVRRMLVPLGPVAVFGASNFPLAYGTLGGDTASALAAGCPVIVKGHPLQPGTGELLARMMVDSILDVLGDSHNKCFAFLHCGGSRANDIGRELVESSWLAGVGFTGSLNGGMALVRIANGRREPIPVFAEMGSSNLVFLLSGVLRTHAEGIADELAGSILDSCGQQCTRPGQLFVPQDEAGDRFLGRLKARFARWRPRAMLGANVAGGYKQPLDEIGEKTPIWRPPGLNTSLIPGTFRAVPAIVEVDPWTWEHGPFFDEIFGPAVIVVRYPADKPTGLISETTLRAHPSLTASVYGSTDDLSGDFGLYWRMLAGDLTRFTGRLVFNGPPTGVRVAHGMVHGGPFPATNRPDTTAVGPFAIERWCRPVCFQNCPDALLPPELQNANPRGILRLVNGHPTRDPVPA